MNTSRLSTAKLKSPSEVRLVEVLDAYLAAAHEGTAPARDVLLAEYPELAEDLEACLASLEFIRQASLIAPPLVPDSNAIEATEGDTGIGDLGDFRLIAEVGRGGMGVVYEAVQRSLNRRVALKVLPFAAAMDPTQLRRFQTEALAAAQLHHTHIVPVYSVGCERGVHYYAMQFIEGQTLAQAITERRRMEEIARPPVRRGSPDRSHAGAEGLLLQSRLQTESGPVKAGTPTPAESLSPCRAETADCARRGPPDPAESADRRSPIPIDTLAQRKAAASATPRPSYRSREYFQAAAALGIQAAEALDHAHKFGIVHRDIKPANLLLDVGGSLWITDFGLARLQDDAGLTITGDLLGTLRYMSPEQALAKRGYLDHRTDIYSLGATLYELVTLRPAIDGRDRQEVLRKIAQEEPAPPRQLNPAIPRELETILLKAMNKEPESRYATAQELADDLRRFLDDKPIGAKRPNLVERAAKWVRRHRTVVAAAFIFLLAAVAGLAASTVLIARKQREVERQRDVARTQLNAANAARTAEAQAREQAEAVSRFLVDAFRRPDPGQDGRELKVVDLLTSAVEKLDTEFSGSLLIRAGLLNALGLTFNDLGLPGQAAKLHEKAQAIRREMLGTDHPDTLTSCNNLVEAYLIAGRAAEALALCEATLKLRESKLGPYHPDTLSSRNNFALALEKAGRSLERVTFCEATFRMCVARLGHEDTQTLTSRNNLAIALRDAGRTDEALVELATTLKVSDARLGPDHPKTLTYRNNLAVALTDAGRCDEAIPLHEATLRVRESKLGPDHWRTIMSRGNVAHAYWMAGRLDVSVPLFQLTLKQSTTKSGPDHPETLRAQVNLGVNYCDAGRPADGARLIEDALRRARGRPETTSLVAWFKVVLAKAYEACGKFSAAEPVFKDQLTQARASFGPHDPRTAGAMTELGQNLLNQQRWSEAEPILRESLAIRAKAQPDAWSTFNTCSMLGGALLGQGRVAEAEPLIVRGYDGLKAREAKIPGISKARVTNGSRNRLVVLYEQSGRPVEAAPWSARLGLGNSDARMPNGVVAFAPTTTDRKEEPIARPSKP